MSRRPVVYGLTLTAWTPEQVALIAERLSGLTASMALEGVSTETVVEPIPDWDPSMGLSIRPASVITYSMEDDNDDED